MESSESRKGWHEGSEVPDPSTGSFIIYKYDGSMAEAEYHKERLNRYEQLEGYWIQYRWSAAVRPQDVLAWCRMSDLQVEIPFLPWTKPENRAAIEAIANEAFQKVLTKRD